MTGHAAVAVALGVGALPRLSPAGRVLILSAIPLVGLTRIYVGAHLPLDVAGGVALGLAVEAAAGLVISRMRTPPSVTRSPCAGAGANRASREPPEASR